MTPSDFKAWRQAQPMPDGKTMTQQEAADALGLSKPTIELYERGFRKGKQSDKPVEIPRTVALACAAIDKGLKPWGQK